MSWRTKPWRRTDPRTTKGLPVDGKWSGGLVRTSNVLARVRREDPEAAEVIELLRSEVGKTCPVHGDLEDPIIAVVRGEVAFGCPDCSGEELRQRWLDEPIEE
jgi:hypothetical protein